MPVRFNTLPSLHILKEHFALDPDHHLVNRTTRGRAGAGKPAGSFDNLSGRVRVHFHGTRYMRARIVWALANSRYPGTMTIDHINGIKTDDRPENLRTATMSEQRINAVMTSRPTSRGIYPYTLKNGEKRFKVAINQRGDNNYIGTFKTKRAACKAYLAAAEDMGFLAFLPARLVSLYTAYGA